MKNTPTQQPAVMNSGIHTLIVPLVKRLALATILGLSAATLHAE